MIKIISKISYKKIEKELKDKFKAKKWILDGKDINAGSEWIQHDNFEEIVEVYKSMLNEDYSAEMCYNGKRYVNANGQIVEKKLPNCRLDFLGLRDGDKIKFQGKQPFEVKNNGILVDGKVVPLSTYVKKNCIRSGKTNEYNGYQYFTYKNKSLYKEWQSLVTCGKKSCK